MTQPEDDVDRAVEAFWRESVFRAGINSMPSYFGPTPLESLRPPAWSWGETPEEADGFVADVVAGSTTGFAMSRAEYDGEPAPQVGEMGIVLDGQDAPRALLVVTEVTYVPRAGLDPDILVEGDDLGDDTMMVLQRIRVLHSV